VPGIILLVISDVLLPSLSQAAAANDAGLSRRYLQGGVRFLCIVGLPIAWLFMLGAKEIIVLLYSEAFREGAIYLRVLIFYALSLPFIDLFAAALSARGQPLLSSVALFSVVPLAVVINIFFILSYGPIGAAYASALTGFFAVLALGVLVYKRFGSLIGSRTLFHIMLAAALMGTIATQITSTGAWLAIVTAGGLALYVLALVLLGEVTWEDVEPFAFWRPAGS